MSVLDAPPTTDLTDLEQRALALRHNRALKLIEHVSPEERVELLAYVVWPTEKIHAATIEMLRSSQQR